MTAIHLVETPTQRQLPRRLVHALAAPFLALLRWWEMRMAIDRVSQFDDASLRDLGIGRSGIENAIRRGRR